MRATLLVLLSVLAPLAAQDRVRVYFGTQARAGSEGIYVAELNTATGELSPLRLAAKLANPGFQALHPDGELLYSTGAGSVAAFRIKDDGTLEKLNEQPSGGSGPCHVHVDRTGRTVLVANYGSGHVAALAIGDDGSLAQSRSVHRHEGRSVNPQRQEGPHAHSVYVDPQNARAFAADLGTDEVVSYALDASAAKLTPLAKTPLPPGSGPRHMKFDADGGHLYVLNEMLLTVAVFAHDADTGTLERRQLISTLPRGASKERMSCSEIRLHPDGRFAYAANRDLTEEGRDSLTTFRIGTDGELERAQVIPAWIRIPRNFELDPSGRWLIVAGQRSHELSIFAVDPNSGMLSFTGRKVKLGTPMCVTFVPSSPDGGRGASRGR